MKKQKILFTPGPLNTSQATKEAMLIDLGTRDVEFSTLVQSIQHKLISLANASAAQYTCIFLQGSGTYGVESVLTSTIKESESLLILSNGAYGERMAQISKKANIAYEIQNFNMVESLPLSVVEKSIMESKATHIAFIHNETTAGVLNDLDAIVKIAHTYNKKIIVDAMSSFGGIPIDLQLLNIDYLITSSNKCLHGVPGIAIVFAKRSTLASCANICHSLSLDLYEQAATMDDSGSFRFTAPTHVLLALNNAIDELVAQGGVVNRFKAYSKRNVLVRSMMETLGFKTLVSKEMQAPMITTFLIPGGFNFNEYYDYMKEAGLLLYSGKLPKYDAFRIGNMGEMSEADINKLETITTQYRKEHNLC